MYPLNSSGAPVDWYYQRMKALEPPPDDLAKLNLISIELAVRNADEQDRRVSLGHGVSEGCDGLAVRFKATTLKISLALKDPNAHRYSMRGDVATASKLASRWSDLGRTRRAQRPRQTPWTLALT